MEFNEATLSQLKRDVGDEVYPHIIKSFHQELTDRLELLRPAISDENIKGIEAQAHSLKSTARTVGLDLLADCASETESAARDLDHSKTKALSLQLCDYTLEAISALSERID